MEAIADQIFDLEQKIQALDAEREKLVQQLTLLEQQQSVALISNQLSVSASAKITHQSPILDKVLLFAELFKGRDDVYPKRWDNSKTGKSGYSPACANEWKPNICEKPRIKCSDCLKRAFIPVGHQTIINHLAGYDPSRTMPNDFVMGVYPLMTDERCWFLAIDFDKASWLKDVNAIVDACKANDIPYTIEKSRSGKGAHVWLFFTRPVSAMEARKLGTFLLTEAMNKR